MDQDDLTNDGDLCNSRAFTLKIILLCLWVCLLLRPNVCMCSRVCVHFVGVVTFVCVCVLSPKSVVCMCFVLFYRFPLCYVRSHICRVRPNRSREHLALFLWFSLLYRGSVCVCRSFAPIALSRTRRTRGRRPPRCPVRAFPRQQIHHPDPIPISTIPTWHSILFYYYRLPGAGCSRRGPVRPFAPYPGGRTATTVAPPVVVAVRSDSVDPPVTGHPSRLVSARGRDRACHC